MRKGSYTSDEFYQGKHRFEHWYRDNFVYFITSRVREGFAAFDVRISRTFPTRDMSAKEDVVSGADHARYTK